MGLPGRSAMCEETSLPQPLGWAIIVDTLPDDAQRSVSHFPTPFADAHVIVARHPPAPGRAGGCAARARGLHGGAQCDEMSGRQVLNLGRVGAGAGAADLEPAAQRFPMAWHERPAGVVGGSISCSRGRRAATEKQASSPPRLAHEDCALRRRARAAGVE